MASKFQCRDDKLLDIGESANQPRCFVFPNRKFGIKNPIERTFQPTWFDKWSWLHYNVDNDSAYCYVCIKAMKEKKIRKAGNMDSAFISRGFMGWKDACAAFRKHEVSESHRAAMEAVVVLPLTTRDVGETLSRRHGEEKAENRAMLLKFYQVSVFCAGRDWLFGGMTHGEESNFMQILRFQCENDQKLALWLEKKRDKFTSPRFKMSF